MARGPSFPGLFQPLSAGWVGGIVRTGLYPFQCRWMVLEGLWGWFWCWVPSYNANARVQKGGKLKFDLVAYDWYDN